MLTLAASMTPSTADFSTAVAIPWIPAIAAVLCTLCAIYRKLNWLAAPICVAGIALSFLIVAFTMLMGEGVSPGSYGKVTAFEWIHIAGLTANFGYFIDPLTVVMLTVVTGVGAIVALYAAGYMRGERGYARFFAYVSLFIFAMTTLVMADNLVLLYLGWEGVGLCSFLLIGFDYHRPAAIAAAKKAFIVNRIGDLGFAIGIFIVYWAFGSVEFDVILPATKAYLGHSVELTAASQAALESVMHFSNLHAGWLSAIPYFLMIGAFGKSAQLPLHTWLPDAMEGPTPVSALIHAATMVTAGVYMIARLIPLFDPAFAPGALLTVATIGAVTALFAATIACCQYDLKKVFAYSTMSQLGYMFMGVAVLSATSGVFHLFTHAFFKALLFLTAGSVMHALAGQLDMRQMSGLRKKLPITFALMGIGCLALAGFPLITAGFYSKDAIIAAVFDRASATESTWIFVLGLSALLTAFLTAYYTFRLFFSVFFGEEKYVMGEAHGPVAEADVDHEAHDHHAEPHEPSWWMNAALVVLAIGALLGGLAGGWIADAITGSTADTAAIIGAAGSHVADTHGADAHAGDHGSHLWVMIASAVIALSGIAVAAWFHWFKRDQAAAIADKSRGLIRVLHNRYYVDEIYDVLIVTPVVGIAANAAAIFDKLVVEDLLVWRLFGAGPGAFARRGFRPLAPGGILQAYGVTMVAGAALLALLVWFVLN